MPKTADADDRHVQHVQQDQSAGFNLGDVVVVKDEADKHVGYHKEAYISEKDMSGDFEGSDEHHNARHDAGDEAGCA